MKVVFMGTPQAAVPSAERLREEGHQIAAVYTQPDRPSGRGNKIKFSPVKDFALRHGLTVVQPSKIRTAEALAEFKAFDADAAIVTAYGRILPEGFLTAFPIGAINVHFSLLPKYRGAAPVNWAVVNGETHTGVTTMQMDAGLDTGDILLDREVAIGRRETADELTTRLSIIGAELLSETLRTYSTIKSRPQDDSAATFAPLMRREDGLIDWSLSADAIANRVRGFQPFPGSYTFYRGSKIIIWKAKPLPIEASNEPPSGEVIKASGGGLIVAAGIGSALLVEELQFEGKRRMSARDAVNGSQIAVGDVFDDGQTSGASRRS